MKVTADKSTDKIHKLNNCKTAPLVVPVARSHGQIDQSTSPYDLPVSLSLPGPQLPANSSTAVTFCLAFTWVLWFQIQVIMLAHQAFTEQFP